MGMARCIVRAAFRAQPFRPIVRGRGRRSATTLPKSGELFDCHSALIRDGKVLLVNLHDVPVAQDFGLVDLLTLEAAVTPKPCELHRVRQIAMNQPRKIGDG
jgi:hypothetical protein